MLIHTKNGYKLYRYFSDESLRNCSIGFHPTDQLEHQNTSSLTDISCHKQSSQVILGNNEDARLNTTFCVSEHQGDKICHSEETLLCKKVPITSSELTSSGKGESHYSDTTMEERISRYKHRKENSQNKQNAVKHGNEDDTSLDVKSKLSAVFIGCFALCMWV